MSRTSVPSAPAALFLRALGRAIRFSVLMFEQRVSGVKTLHLLGRNLFVNAVRSGVVGMKFLRSGAVGSLDLTPCGGSGES